MNRVYLDNNATMMIDSEARGDDKENTDSKAY